VAFDFAKDCAVKREHFEQGDSVPLLPGFMNSGSLTLLYSPPKQGKSWLAYGIAKTLSAGEEIKEIYYLDMDNSFSTMKERGFDVHLFTVEGLTCMTKATIKDTALAKLSEIASYAKGNDAFEGVLFVIDTIKDFINFDSKTQATEFMHYLTQMRDAGATLLVLHHSNKNEKGISGNQAFINSSDNIYSLKQTNKEDGKLFFSLTVTHARGMVEDKNFSVDTQTLELLEEQDPSVMLDEYESAFVAKAKAALTKEPQGLNKSALLQKLGYRRDDKRHGRMLEQFVDTFWKVEKDRNIKTFKLK